MKRRPDPTPEVARARRYAARVRIVLALVGGALIVVEPEVALHPAPAAIGLAVADVWDGTSLDGQERAIGRRKENGAPLGGRREHDRVDLEAERDGAPAIPLDAHIRHASPKSNGGERILRRSYSFGDGAITDEAQLDAGLFFGCFQRDPRRQFVRIQRRLAERDALAKHLLHTGSAVFGCPPGARSGGYVGETLVRQT